MQTAARSNLILTDFSSFYPFADLQSPIETAHLNQRISHALIRAINKRHSLDLLATHLIAIADRAYPFRRMDVVEQASDILLTLPLPRKFKSIAHYYKAYCIKRRGQLDEAQNIFEQVVDEVPTEYRARGIIGLGSVAFDKGDFQSAIRLYIQASRAVIRAREFDPVAAFYTQTAFAILKSIDGNHKGALTDLESMFPLVRAVSLCYPALYYNYLNGVAVELLEIGRIEEAQNACQMMLTSPYAIAYPEMLDTWNEVQLKGYKSRLIKPYHPRVLSNKNLLRLPIPESLPNDYSANPTARQPYQQASVFDLLKWKKKMRKKANADRKDIKAPQEMTEKQMLYRIIHLFTQSEVSEAKHIEMLESVERIFARPDNLQD